jgi:phosphohistidine phosphatase
VSGNEKHLFLMRHAKTLPDSESGEDHDRALSPRGLQQCAEIRKRLLPLLPKSRIVLCSSALRTRQTCEQLGLADQHTQFLDALYLSSPDTLAHYVHQALSNSDGVIVIAHNPGLRQWNADLAATANCKDPLRQLAAERFPTSWVAQYHVTAEHPYKSLSFMDFISSGI